MKTLILSLLTLAFSINALANKQDVFTYYQPGYEIVSAGPICPVQPSGYSCRAVGTMIKIKASLNGCLDKVAYFDKQIKVTDGVVTVFTSAVAKFNPKNDRVRCVKMPEDYQTIILPREDYVDFKLENLKINSNL